MLGDYHGSFFTLVCTGIGLFLVGGTNLVLLLLRSGMGLRVGATLTSLVVALTVAAVLDHPDVTGRTASLLGAGVATCLVLGWRRLMTQLGAWITSFQNPVFRFGLLSATGLGLVFWSIVTYDRLDRETADVALADLERMHAGVPNVPRTPRATTDRGNPIAVQEPADANGMDQLLAREEWTIRHAKLDDQVIRRSPADGRSNCHGWVFTGGRFALSPGDVERILEENGYREVLEPRVGDLIVYGRHAGITHTGIVRYVTEGQQPLIESKWGTLGVYLHPADKSLCQSDFTFFRSSRSGHLLVGVGGSPRPREGPPQLLTE